MLIIRRSKLYYTASGIITPVGGRPVHRSNSIFTFANDRALSNNLFNSITEQCVLLSWSYGVYEHLEWRVDKNDGKAKGSVID